MDTVALRVFARDVLGPTLRPGQVVAVDNLSAHLDPRARVIIEAREYTLIRLPTYSPDPAPDEPAFAKIKAHLRGVVGDDSFDNEPAQPERTRRVGKKGLAPTLQRA